MIINNDLYLWPDLLELATSVSHGSCEGSAYPHLHLTESPRTLRLREALTHSMEITSKRLLSPDSPDHQLLSIG